MAAEPIVVAVNDIRLRAAAARDVDAITRLVHDAFGKYVERIGVPPGPMLRDYAAVLTVSRVWVLEAVGGGLEGLLVVEAADDHLHIDVVAVAPAAQGRGHGARLLARAEDDARELRLPEVRLHTNVAMTENQVFYPRHGYVETGRGRRDGYERVFYAKTVDADARE
jgi:ribosomal protein S18 acetylase RimI-like enzyme